MKKKYALIIIVLASLIILELGIESYLYHKRYDEPLALLLVFKTLIAPKSTPLCYEYPSSYKVDYREDNPFISFRKTKERKLHPFIGWVTAYTNNDYLSHFGTSTELDYFGYRNKEDLYFDDKNYTLVVMTGSGDLAGWTHTLTIAENLERILNTRFNNTFKVLNLGMHDYTISNEISSYVHLVYHLKPEFVIAHTAWNDMASGLLAPYNFKKIGLIYWKNLEYWLPKLYYLTDYSGFRGLTIDPKGSEMIVDNFLKRLNEYEKIVASNGGRLIVGIQPHNPYFFDYNTTLYGRVDVLYKELSKKISDEEYIYIDWTKDKRLNVIDHIHTDDYSSEIMAEGYAEIIEDYYTT